MVNFNDRYRNNKRRWLLYITGFIAVLAIVIIGVFYTAKPYLDSFLKKEMARHSISAETSETSIMGKINLTNVIVPAPKGVSLRIGAVSGRPPISFIPGAFTLYNVDLRYNNIHLQIPRVSISDISLKAKNTAIPSRLLQSLMRIDIESIVASDILLSVKNENKPTEKVDIKNFKLTDLRNGRIRSIDIKNISTKTDSATVTKDSTKQAYLLLESGAVKVRNIDLGYAYSIIFGKNPTDNRSETITGPIALENVTLNIFGETEKKSSFSLGKLQTSGLKMKPFKQNLKQLIQTYLDAKNSNNRVAEKTVQNAIIVNILSAITSIDAQIDKAIIDTPKLKTTLESFQLQPSQWQQSVPEKLLISFSSLSISPKELEKHDLDLLKDMNLESFDFSGKVDIAYNEKKRTLFLNTISFGVRDVGSGEVSAKIINVDEALFSGQKDAIAATTQNLGVTEIDIRYTDAGFIDKLFSYFAKNLTDNKHDLKKELYDDFYLIMTQSPSILLKDHAEAEEVAKSFGDFAQNPQTLTIKIRAKDDKGLTAADLETALQRDLSAALKKVNLIVKNEVIH
ncbi:hypothetical protein BAnh1_03340 [Bartonella australis AUST/NH1]|uniref:Uncharacterized protein n=1 Tax=Bartonella australis (strain Aust/NH1) TaxID=1094489 RepID=M1NXL1_BARAA|nr:hypothetical protein [Bartonella australis]AGF74217.1 hypothetical protein BAnh1_03340 [Bartonella australis AUST/NH1]